jgi:CRISPR-associated endoribonuclease Cas6
MLARISLSAEKPIALPFSYHEVLQGFIYRNIDAGLASHIHDQGFVSNGRSFKLFTFSKILDKGVLNAERTKLSFDGQLQFAVCSPMAFFIRSLVSSLSANSSLKLWHNTVKLTAFSITDNILNTAGNVKVSVKTLSPVTIYSTLHKADGKGVYTRYFFPNDKLYSEMLTENLLNKAASMGLTAPSSFLKVKGGRTYTEALTKYKNFIVKGYEGELELSGDAQLINIALECGLGAKNSMGFGCIELQ